MYRKTIVGLCAVLVAVVVFLGAPTCVRGADSKEPKIISVSADLNQPTILDVLFDTPYPDQKDVSSGDNWIVFGKNKQGIVKKYKIESVDATALSPTSMNEKKVVLELTEPLPRDVSIDLTLVNSKAVLHVSAPNIFGVGTPAQAPFRACTGKGDCDIYITGSYTAAIGTSPLYAIDSFGGYMRSIMETKNVGKIGFYGQVQEKSSTTANPDSFLAYFDYQYVLGNDGLFGPPHLKMFQAPILNSRFAGTEFNKTGDDVNFVTSPMVSFPIRLSGKLSDPVKQGITFPLLTLEFGTEFVDVQRSVLATTNTWHARGLMGATFAGGIPVKKPFFYSIQLTSSYQLRLPSADEIYFDPKFAPINPTTGKPGTIPPHLGTQPRHYVDNKVTYNVLQWFGFTFENTYGSLPPSFVKTNQTFTLGLTFTLAQTSYGRYSILKP